MPTRNRLGRLGGFVRAFGSAVAAASAVERGKVPSSQDLRNLGIDPAQFDRIGR